MPNLTVSENIALPLQILGGSNNGTFENIINTVGLSEATNKFPKDLSGGMKTRTALARSFITNPKLLLLDEPFSALDLGWKNTLYKELNALQAANNTCVVMVTHDIEEAVELGSRILVLSHSGAGIAEYTPNATNKETLRKEIKDVVLKDHSSFINQAR